MAVHDGPDRAQRVEEPSRRFVIGQLDAGNHAHASNLADEWVVLEGAQTLLEVGSPVVTGLLDDPL